MKEIILESEVPLDDISSQISQMFDYEFTGKTTFKRNMPDFPTDYGIGLIVGPSGSGKSTMLRQIGDIAQPDWDETLSVASNFGSADEAQRRLSGVGFNSIPSWLRPRSVLSTGEGFRADMAKVIADGACIDEFTSVVDRVVAKSCSNAVKRLIDYEGIRGVTFASCHYDIIEWLQPDWVFDTLSGDFLARGSLHRPPIEIDLQPCNTEVWPVFMPHHYLSENINKGARCWLARWDGTPVGFVSAIAFPNAHWKNGWRGHRTVCLPDYQGLGIGVRISDAAGEIFLSEGCRYFSKTAHPRIGEYRESSPKWRATSKNRMSRQDYKNNRVTKESKYKWDHADRVTYSHEYIGE